MFIADTTFWYRKKTASQIYLIIVDTQHFLWKNIDKLLFNFQMLLFGTLLYFSTTPFTALYLVSHKEFHEFPELGRRIVQNTRISRNLVPMKLPRNLYKADNLL